MPLYDVLAIVKGAMPQQQVSMILKRAANAVLDNGGVLTDIKSYGVNELAYGIRKYGELHHEVWAMPFCAPAGCEARSPRSAKGLTADPYFPPLQGHYIQLSFFSSPATLPVLEHNFRTDERLLRHVVVKKKAVPNLPKPKQLKIIQEEM